MEETELCSEVEEVVYMYMDMLSHDGVTLNCHIEDDLPPILGDRARLKQVFINLLDNAAKHGGEGKRIDVTLRREGDNLVVSVRDYGPGIPEDELPHIKYKFYKGSSKARGSGIGLAVSDEIVRLHGGELKIQSAVAEGTEALVILPLHIGGGVG
jgi:signal transduction histidine kinase